ncbi:MAG: hypothetical protein H7X95_06790 [Deltaproteobacteria bacterium]|nr:hypothetical protein [Deltaproteobacteria bacterium]
MKIPRLIAFGVVPTVLLVSLAGCGSGTSPMTNGTGGRAGTGGLGSGGLGSGGSASGGSGSGGAVDGGGQDRPSGDAPVGGSTNMGSGGTAGATGGGGAAGAAGGSTGLGGAGGSVPTLAQLCASSGGGMGVGGAAGAGGAAGGSGVAPPMLSFTNQTYAGDSRVVASEAVFSFINTLDDPRVQTMRLRNAGTTAVMITSLHVVDNTRAPAANPPSTPGPRGGTLFPLNYNHASLPSAFKISANGTLPMLLAAGANLDVTVQFLSSKTNPPDRMLNVGGHAVSAVLVAQTAMGCVPAGLYGVGLWNDSETPPDAVTGLPSNNWARYEPTFGQIVATLGYKVNLGAAFIQLLNTNDMSIPGVGFSTEEVQVRKFTKADPNAPVQLLAVARFAPPLDTPFGWYPVGTLTGTAGTGGAAGASGAAGAGGAAGTGGGTAGAGGAAGAGAVGGAAGPPVVVTDAQPAAIPSGSTQAATQPAPLRVVATMLSSPRGVDWNTSNYSIQVLPPLRSDSNATTFDPGPTAVFGLWAFSNQRTIGNPSSAGVPGPNVANGDYNYTENALNIPAAQSHRVRVYPLKDRAGVRVPNSYLLGWEEAGNGDYQDFVFVLKNVNPAP